MPISANPSASEINVELGRAATAPFDINGAEERALAGVPSGPITFADFIGKSAQTPYERYLDWLTTYTGGSFVSSSASNINMARYVWVRCEDWAKQGDMWGSPIHRYSQVYITTDSSIRRVMQHMVETEAEFDLLIANQWRAALVKLNDDGSLAPFSPFDRNGYLSQSYGQFFSGTQGITAVWWDGQYGWRRDSYEPLNPGPPSRTIVFDPNA